MKLIKKFKKRIKQRRRIIGRGRTSQEVASIAGKILRAYWSSRVAKILAGSALVQRRRLKKRFLTR